MIPTELSYQQYSRAKQASGELRWLIPLAIIISIEFTWVLATWGPDINEVLLRFIVLAAIGVRTASNLFVAGYSR